MSSMTENEWVTCPDPERLLDHLQGAVSDRKLRLFAAACARRAWRLFTEWELSDHVLLSEQFADGEVSPQTLEEIRSRLGARGGISSRWAADNVVHSVLREKADEAARDASYFSRELVRLSILEMGSSNFDRFKPAADAARAAEREEQAEVLRDLIGNPFRPAALAADWCTPKVARLARDMYDQRNFNPMWPLADALRAAGCADAAVLAHCEQSGEHYRGCWLIDAILKIV